MDGGDGNDTITGSEFADDLFGGGDADRIIGDNNPAGSRDLAWVTTATTRWSGIPATATTPTRAATASTRSRSTAAAAREQFTVAPGAGGQIAFDRVAPAPFNVDIGTSERLDLNAGGGDDTMDSTTAVGFALDIDGGDGNDTLDGGDGPDLITGGAGNDRILGDNNPAATRDNSVGGDGDDTLVWNPGDGDDTNEGGAGNDTIEVNGGGGAEQFTVAPGAGGRIAFNRVAPAPFNVDIGTAERLDLNAGGGDDSMVSTTVVGFAARHRRRRRQRHPRRRRRARPDHRRGGQRPHRRRQQPGRHPRQLRGRRRRRHARLEPRRRRRHQRGRRRQRHASRSTAAPAASSSPSHRGPAGGSRSTAPARRHPARSTSTSAPPSGSTSTPTAATTAWSPRPRVGFALDIDGGDGNDTLDGGDEPDLITGGAGNDRITGDNNPAATRDNSVGGDGDDTLVWNPGDGDDTNEGGAGNDTIEVNGGAGGEVFTVRPSPTAGRVLFDRTGPTPPGPFNLDIGTAERLVLNAGDGNDRITGARGLAGRIASTFNGDAGNDRITGTDGADRLDGGAGNDVIRAADTRSDRVLCGTGRDLARVDRRDRPRACEVVIGGALRVRVLGRVVDVTLGRAVVRVRCVGTRRCRGTVRLLRNGRSLGTARFTATRRRAKRVRVKLNRRGRRLVAGAPPRGVRIQVQINARDSVGNGWRTTKRMRLTR